MFTERTLEFIKTCLSLWIKIQFFVSWLFMLFMLHGSPGFCHSGIKMSLLFIFIWKSQTEEIKYAQQRGSMLPFWYCETVYLHLCEMLFSNYDMAYSDQKFSLAQDSDSGGKSYPFSGSLENDVNLRQFLIAHWGFSTEKCHRNLT